MLTDRQRLGLKGEAIAAAWLQQRGWRILDRRFRSGHRDLDLVAAYEDVTTRERVIAFIEVRARASSLFGHPIETVHWKKQRDLRRAARDWLRSNVRSASSYRFDLIGVVFDSADPKIEYIPNAF